MNLKEIATPISIPLSRMAWLLVGLAAVLWAYWTTLGEAAEKWASDPQYSHGYLVPLFALGLLWWRRDIVKNSSFKPSGWGVILVLVSIGLRLAGTFYYFVWFDAISLLPCLVGLFLLVGGKTALRWSWPAIAFLVFMIPLPYRLEVMMGGPLQRFATVTSTFALQTLGLPALAEGTVILINEISIGIVEACSGLRMLVIFFALSTAVALIMRRPLWEKILIVASAVPIALIVNVIRIIATGILHDTVGKEVADAVFHDLAGWLMMPLGLAMLGIELALLKHLFIESHPVLSPVGMTLPAVSSPVVRARTGRKKSETWQPFQQKSKE